MRQAKEHEIESFDRRKVELGEHEIGVRDSEAGIQRRCQRSSLRVASSDDDFVIGMLRSDTQELSPGVTTCANNAYSDHRRMIIQRAA
ncbi:unannotated protein [freshwater metagenome]|uniref:Unannotated protein n=1 Tax=freshwater metagenome TaxID=449393 RepID=A0A6J6PK08_9ZZZZ